MRKTVVKQKLKDVSDRQIETVERFVENGGGVVIIGQTAWYDEYGRLRRERLGFHFQYSPYEFVCFCDDLFGPPEVSLDM